MEAERPGFETPILSLSSCVILEKLLNFSEHNSLICQRRIVVLRPGHMRNIDDSSVVTKRDVAEEVTEERKTEP